MAALAVALKPWGNAMDQYPTLAKLGEMLITLRLEAISIGLAKDILTTSAGRMRWKTTATTVATTTSTAKSSCIPVALSIAKGGWLCRNRSATIVASCQQHVLATHSHCAGYNTTRTATVL
jgi:hypothetical protein